MSGGYERLSALDHSFLLFERPEAHMHVGGVLVFEAGALRGPDGSFDIDRFRSYVGSRLHRIPRYRQRLAHVPLEGRPVWVDDARLNLHYHVRHTSLPRPGSERQLKRLAGRVMSEQLDRGKPLWEIWAVEGLEGDRIALLMKAHHCMIDGVSGVDLVSVLLRPSPESAFKPGPAWVPRPVPSPLRLLRDELVHRTALPLRALFGVPGALREPEHVLDEVRQRAVALARTVGGALESASQTPLNRPIGPHRRLDWLTTELADLAAVNERWGGTMNDVVLAAVTAALRRFLEGRRFNVDLLHMRALVPVSVRHGDERGTFGNRVAAWFVDLPIAERDPRACFDRVAATTAEMKQSGQASGAELFTQATELAPSLLLSLASRLATFALPFNLVITNVPGPPVNLYLLGARLLDSYPVVPLFVNQGLGVALLSYAGRLHWGISADWDQVPDLHDFVLALDASFADLLSAARRSGRTAGADAGRGGRGTAPARRNTHRAPDTRRPVTSSGR